MKYDPEKHHRRSIRLKGYDYAQAGAYFITICCQNRECRFGTIENDQMMLNEYGQIAYDEWMALPERFANCSLDVFQIMPNHMHGIIVLDGAAAVGAGFTPAANAGLHPAFAAGNPAATEWIGQPSTGEPPFLGQPDSIGQPQGLPQRAPSLGEPPFLGEPDLIGQPRGLPQRAPSVGEPLGLPRPIGDIVGSYKSLVFNRCLDIYKSINQFMGKLWQRNYYEHIIRNEQAYLKISHYIIHNPENWKCDKFYG